jgi:toluene monooxygenase system protein E
MSDVQVLKPLKTWSHLASRRRKPSEYEIVSANLHYSTRDPNAPWELDPDVFMNTWYKQHRNGSSLQHDDWNAFRDPEEIVYRTYNLKQDGQETYVYGLFDQFNAREHDKGLDEAWVVALGRIYTPSRYLFHTLQMASAYVGQMAPASTITNCAYFQMADSLRWLSHTAYRTKELSLAFPDVGFDRNERMVWEELPQWQGFRELMEKVLVTWDWAEAFVALNLVAQPAMEESVLRALGESARHNGDTLLGLLTDAQLIDAARHRRWAAALVKMALEKAGNREVIKGWIAKWELLADAAIDAYCAGLPDAFGAADEAKRAVREFGAGLGL